MPMTARQGLLGHPLHALLVALTWLAAAAHAQLPAEVPSLAPMIERVSPAVVNISISGRVTFSSPYADDPLFRPFLPERGERPVRSSGSGVIVDSQQGYVLTNHHVVASADRITVTLFDGRSMEASVIGTDEQSDIAVLKIEADGLAQIEFGDSNRVRVGDFVVAIGNPFGLSHTVTSGIVSGLGRNSISPDDQAYEDFIQTDASINPGNSGGALVGLTGELLGINSAILSRSGGNIGIGFAIPVNMARYVMSELVASGRVTRGALGVNINTVTPEIAATRGLRSTRGAVIARVAPDSAAARAGLRTDDVIVSVDGQPVRDAGSLRAAIGLHPPGDRVQIGILRDGREELVEAQLGEAEETTRMLLETAAPVPLQVFDGVELRPSGEAAEAGLLVARVDAGSVASQRGLRAGDLITHMNTQRITSIRAAAAIVAGAESVVLEVRRGRRSVSIVMR
jgi:Do/DeqQ family serine protease